MFTLRLAANWVDLLKCRILPSVALLGLLFIEAEFYIGIEENRVREGVDSIYFSVL